MKLHKPKRGSWSITVLDQHLGVYAFEAETSEEVYRWMQRTNEIAFATDFEEWQEIAATVLQEGSVRVETEFDCDYVVVKSPT